MWEALFTRIEKMLPERYRLRLVSCAAFAGVLVLGYVLSHDFETKGAAQDGDKAIIAQLAQFSSKVMDKFAHDESTQKREELSRLRSRILSTTARCHDSKSLEARGLYERSLTDMLAQYERSAGAEFPQAVSCE